MENRRLSPEVTNVLRATLDFEAAILPIIDQVPIVDSSRSKLATVFVGLAHEHWRTLRVLMSEGLTHSAIALLRLQFEATLKAFYVAHAASDAWVERAGTVRAAEGRVQESGAPGVGEMPGGIGRSAPPHAARLLDLFRSIAWRELNSYVHGGTLALASLVRPVPASFLVQMVKNANGVWSLGAMLCAAQSREPARMLAVLELQHAHAACLPPVAGTKTGSS